VTSIKGVNALRKEPWILLLLLTALGVIAYEVWAARGEMLPTGGIAIGEGEIHLSGVVNKGEGWVQFLACPRQYDWLAMDSAIALDARLTEVQRAIGARGLEPAQAAPIAVQWDGGSAGVAELTFTAGETLRLKDILFLGSEVLDAAKLWEVEQGLCWGCPLLPVEQEALVQEFIRPSGESGFMLNPGRMPPKGTRVIVAISY